MHSRAASSMLYKYGVVHLVGHEGDREQGRRDKGSWGPGIKLLMKSVVQCHLWFQPEALQIQSETANLSAWQAQLSRELVWPATASIVSMHAADMPSHRLKPTHQQDSNRTLSHNEQT